MTLRIRVLPPSNQEDITKYNHSPRYDYLDKGKFYVPIQKDYWIYAGILEQWEFDTPQSETGEWKPVEIVET